MPRRDRSMSLAMKRLSRPISMILSEFGRKPSDLFIDTSTPIGAFDAGKALPLDFKQSAAVDFEFEKELDSKLASTASSELELENSFNTAPSFDDSITSSLPSSLPLSPSTSSRLSGASWHIKKDHAIYIYQDNASMSPKEAYNPFSY